MAREGTGFVVTGAAGRMGGMLIRAAAEQVGPERDALPLSAALVRPGHPWVGRDAGEALGLGPLGAPVLDDPIRAFATARAVLDFTTPEALETHAMLAAQARAALVVGTTGLGPEHLALLERAARHAPVVRASNTSLGVSVLADLAARAAAALPGWDVEIVEAHHRAKRDAPSGTALMLGEAAAGARGRALAEVAAHDRAGLRPDDAIGFAVVRGGDVVGEHDVALLGPGERLVLRHVASDRMIFARGAVRAALWAVDRPPGLYGMADVLGV